MDTAVSAYSKCILTLQSHRLSTVYMSHLPYNPRGLTYLLMIRISSIVNAYLTYICAMVLRQAL